jgi:hypothetical protein
MKRRTRSKRTREEERENTIFCNSCFCRSDARSLFACALFFFGTCSRLNALSIIFS